MTTVQVKLRQLKKGSLLGTVYYQLHHLGKMQQIPSSIHIPFEYWDPRTNRIYGTALTHNTSLQLCQSQIESDLKLIRGIISDLKTSDTPFTTADIADQFRSVTQQSMFLEYFNLQIDNLSRDGKYGTARNYKRTYTSFATFLNGQDFPFHQFNEELVSAYNRWLSMRGIIRNTTSFYMRMFFGHPILAYDVVYNRETTHNEAYYFDTAEVLEQLLRRNDLTGDAMKAYAAEHYTWSHIARQYEALY